MSTNEEAAYDNTHRALLQAFLGRSIFTLPQAKPVLAAILNASQPNERSVLPGDITDTDFLSYVSAINAALSPFDIEIRSTYTQGPDARTRMWALVNTTSDPITQLATTHTPDEIAFLKRVLDDMFDKYNTPQREIMAISNMQALRLLKAGTSDRNSGIGRDMALDGIVTSQEVARTTSQGIGIRQADKMLQSLVDEGWFEKHRDYYVLSPRALMELRGWILETYNDTVDIDGEGGGERVKLCHACRDIVTNGQRCSIPTCKARLHDHCARSVWRAQSAATCPLCREPWTGTDFVGLRVVQGGERRQRGDVAGQGPTVDDESSREDG